MGVQHAKDLQQSGYQSAFVTHKEQDNLLLDIHSLQLAYYCIYFACTYVSYMCRSGETQLSPAIYWHPRHQSDL